MRSSWRQKRGVLLVRSVEGMVLLMHDPAALHHDNGLHAGRRIPRRAECLQDRSVNQTAVDSGWQRTGGPRSGRERHTGGLLWIARRRHVRRCSTGRELDRVLGGSVATTINAPLATTPVTMPATPRRTHFDLTAPPEHQLTDRARGHGIAVSHHHLLSRTVKGGREAAAVESTTLKTTIPATPESTTAAPTATEAPPTRRSRHLRPRKLRPPRLRRHLRRPQRDPPKGGPPADLV